MGQKTLQIQSDIRGAGKLKFSAGQLALLLDTGRSSWMEAEACDIDGSGGIITARSIIRNQTDQSEMTMVPTSAATCPYLVNGAGSLKSMKFGYDSVGATSSTHGPIRGGSNYLLPTGDWIFGGRFKSHLADAGSISAMISSSGQPSQISLAFTNAGQLRFYYDYSTSLLTGSGTVFTTDTWHTVIAKYVSGTLGVTCDGVSNISSAVTVPALTSRALRMSGLTNDSGVDPTLAGRFECDFFVAGAYSAALEARIAARAAERAAA